MKLKLTVALAMGVVTSMSMAQEVVKIGHVAPLSGAIAHLGKDNEYGARLAIEELGPTFIKFGQILADRPDLITEGLRKELKKLQRNTRLDDRNRISN